MTDNVKKSHYEVGYGKPPVTSRFKPGQCGNPQGKPKGAKNLATVVGNAIKEKVAVTENGKRKMVSKLEVAVKQLVNKAASGDHKAMMQLMSLVQMIEGRAETDPTATPVFGEADLLVMDSIIARIRSGAVNPAGQDAHGTTNDKENSHDVADHK
jgi:hypothetical protein